MNAPALGCISDREWILTNGTGAYALGFGNMVNKRKYDGLLIAERHQHKRVHTLATIEEQVESGGTVFPLDSNHYLNCIHPNGAAHIVESWLRPYPCALFSTLPPNPGFVVFKEIFLAEGKNVVVVRYTNRGEQPIELTLRPKFTLRDHHAVNTPGTWDRVGLERGTNDGFFTVRRSDNGYGACGYIEHGEILEDQAIYRSVFYPLEAARGYDAAEDLIAPFRIRCTLAPQESVRFVCSAEPLDAPFEIAEQAQKRYAKLPLPADHPKRAGATTTPKHTDAILFEKNEALQILEFAARDFFGADSDLLAGYPWFGAWARDSLICLGGLRRLKGGTKRGVGLLKRYAKALRHGLLPNTFGEGGEGLNYDSIDAPLWFALRCFEYAPTDRDLLNAAGRVVLHYLFDDRHPFFTSEDGLIEIQQGDYGLTWMDAKIYGKPVTPRWGKPVEINALWYNALRAVVAMAEIQGVGELECHSQRCDIATVAAHAEKVRQSFSAFVGENFLADRIEGDSPIWEIRPNAVIALSLPFDVVDTDVCARVFRTAREKLLTPYGLRSLDPANPAFKQKYVGSQKQRDFAYHQGTVWTFLLLPYVMLARKVLKQNGSDEGWIKEATRTAWTLRNDLMRGELASIPEIWDGIDPKLPKGCPAQAWSVFALLEIEHLLLDAQNGQGA